MLNIDRALGDDRLIKAITGLSASEFNKLIERFMEEFQNEAQARYETGVELGNRERKPGGGRIGNLGSYATKLFFTLFYFKCYPTFDILGFLFDLDRSNAHRNAHKLASILEKALGKEMVLPARNRIVSGFRVLVEHAIGGIKRFWIVSDGWHELYITPT
jgi:hypothetical protein